VATTTTWPLIRANYHTKIDALTPTRISRPLFRRAPTNVRLQDWATGIAAGNSAALRKYEFTREDATDAEVMDPTAFERNETVLLTVAYPVAVALYGAAEFDEIDAVMRQDAAQLRDCLFSAGNYLSGQSAAFPEILAPVMDDERCWFQSLRVTLIWTESQTLV
jgi:hypothetical protein